MKLLLILSLFAATECPPYHQVLICSPCFDNEIAGFEYWGTCPGASSIETAPQWIQDYWHGLDSKPESLTAQQVPCTADTCPPENPEEPTDIIPPPPLFCPDGTIAECNPVSDITCIEFCGISGDNLITPLNSFELYPDSGLFNQFFSHLEAEQHYYHCARNNVQLQQVFFSVGPTVCAAPKINDFIDAVFACERDLTGCTEFRTWSGGNLYKPNSDNTGQPVILVGDEYNGQDCSAIDSNGNAVAACDFRTCCPNGGRAHFDVRANCSTLPPFIFKIGSTCWMVDEPCQRME